MAGPSPPNGKRKGRGKGGRKSGGGGGRSKAVKKGAASKSKSALAPGRTSARLSKLERKDYAVSGSEDESGEEDSDEEVTKPSSRKKAKVAPRKKAARGAAESKSASASGRASSSRISKLEQYDGSSSEDESEGGSYSSEEEAPKKKAKAAPRKKAPRATKKAVAIKSGDDAMELEERGDAGGYFLKDVVKKEKDITGRKFMCKTDGCNLVGCVIYALSNSANRAGRTRNIPACLDCQAKDYGGWPLKEKLEALKFKYLPPELRAALLDLCTKFPGLRDEEMPDLLEFGSYERTLRNAATPGGTKIFGKNNLLEYIQQRKLDDVEKFSTGARKSALRELGFAMDGSPDEQKKRLVDGVAGKKVKLSGEGRGAGAVQRNEARREASIEANGGKADWDIAIECFLQMGRCRDGCMGFRAVPEDEPYSFLLLTGLLCGVGQDHTAAGMVAKLSDCWGLIVCFFDKDGNRIDSVNGRKDWDRTFFMVKHVAIKEEWAQKPPRTGQPLREVFPLMTDDQIRSLGEDPSKMRKNMPRA